MAALDTSWTLKAACRGSTRMFYSDSSDSSETEKALEVCAGCTVRVECLEYAIATGEAFGTWGGMAQERRELLRRLRGHSEQQYQHRLGQEMAELGRRVGGHDDDRPIELERLCDRCDRTIPEGRHPIDRNGPGATCGRPATYNKGCRCEGCAEGKADMVARQATKAEADGDDWVQLVLWSEVA